MTKKPIETKVKLKTARTGSANGRLKKRKPRKQFNLLPLIFVSILAVVFYFSHKPIMKVIAELNRPVEKKVVEKQKVKKKKIVKKEAPKIVKKEIPEYIAPKKEYFKGEIKHYTFGEIAKKHCFSCHGAEGQEVEGKFNFVQFLAEGTSNPKAWKVIYEEISKGNMPPEGETPLNSDEKEVMLAAIKKMTAGHEVTRKTRMLTPNEIKNTIFDIFQIDSAVYDPFSKLAQNYTNDAFYTCQENRLTPFYLDDLFASLNHAVNSYVSLNAQLKPLQQSVYFTPTPNVSSQVGNTHKIFFNGGMSEINFRKFKSKRQLTQEARENERMTREQIEQQNEFEKRSLPPGTYKLSFDAQSLNLDPNYLNPKKYGQWVINHYKKYLSGEDYSLPINFYAIPPGRLDFGAKSKLIRSIDIDSTELSRYTIKFTLSRRSGIGYKLGKPMPRGNNINKSMTVHLTKIPNPDIDILTANYRKYIFIPKPELPHVSFSNIRIEGPFDVQVNGYSFDKDDRLNEFTVRKKFRNLHADVNLKNNTVFSYIYHKLKQTKLDDNESYKTAMTSFFMSPDFLILKNNKKDKENFARYVSYSLHKSHPTKEFVDLLEKARRSKDSQELTDWLVNHKNFERFVENFSYQWLDIAKIFNNRPVEDKFGRFHKYSFMDAYQIEAKKFLLHLYKNNLPIKEMVTANYSFVNAELEDMYNGGSSNHHLPRAWKPVRPKAQDFKKVIFSDKNRGGVLTMGGFLTATGNGVDGLPLKRAKWVLENLLDSKLLPPPADVDVSSFDSGEHGHTIKEKLAAHSKDPACYSCHKRMDPIAIMMDKYNTIGGDNHEYRRETVMINDKKVSSIADLKQYIGNQEKVLARAYTKKILQFTLGRELYVQDESKLTHIIEENKDTGFKLRDLLNSVVKHYFL